MKKIILSLILIMGITSINAQNLNTEMEKVSYSLGVNVAKSVKNQGLTSIDSEAIAQAFSDVFEGNELKIHYLKTEPEKPLSEGYIYHGLSKKSFSLGYKIAPKFDIDLTDAKLEHGLLHIFIPLVEEAKKKTVTIN